MQKKWYSKELGGTAGCSMRIIEASQYSGRLEKQRIDAKEAGKRELFFGDSWFTSRRLCEGLKDINLVTSILGPSKLPTAVHQKLKLMR